MIFKYKFELHIFVYQIVLKIKNHFLFQFLWSFFFLILELLNLFQFRNEKLTCWNIRFYTPIVHLQYLDYPNALEFRQSIFGFNGQLINYRSPSFTSKLLQIYIATHIHTYASVYKSTLTKLNH